MKKVLLHTCCAPCAAPSGKRLLLDDYEVVLFFSNMNISPKEEYDKRLESARKLAQIWDVVIEDDLYDHDKWLEHIKGLENEPEKGERCSACFEFSLRRTAEVANRLGIPNFSTTLTLSPHKVSKIIFKIGEQFPGYIPFDFKKKNGFLESTQLSKEYGLYRQNYCGCEFSIRD
jgi:predicted adenine nucleotide alpha hydrolase (AANH) superfamily ATPase